MPSVLVFKKLHYTKKLTFLCITSPSSLTYDELIPEPIISQSRVNLNLKLPKKQIEYTLSLFMLHEDPSFRVWLMGIFKTIISGILTYDLLV